MPSSVTTTYQRSSSDFSLTISPARLVVAADDIGKTQQILVVNRGRSALDVTVQKRNFTAGADGALEYQQDAPYAAASWVKLSQTQLTLAPGTSRTVTAKIVAPATAEPGDHQVAVVFLVPAGKTAGNVRINRGIATPVFITVPGKVDDTVSLTGLHAPGFVRGGSVPVTATVHNLGSVHRDFRSPSPLTLAAAGRSTPFPDFTVPRDSVRTVSTSWNPPLLCVCHPTVTFSNPGAPLQTATVRVIVFPWPQLLALIGIVLLALLSVRLARRRYRGSVARAVAAAQQPDRRGDG